MVAQSQSHKPLKESAFEIRLDAPSPKASAAADRARFEAFAERTRIQAELRGEKE